MKTVTASQLTITNQTAISHQNAKKDTSLMFYVVAQKAFTCLSITRVLYGKPYRKINDFDKSIHSLKNTRT